MKASCPKISVLMPVFNSARYLKEAIESILNQNFTDFEFIIVYDESTDNSLEIIESFQKVDPRIVLIENQKENNIVGALNTGLEAAKGEYIARMDSDDISLPQRFAVQVDFMDSHSNVGICGGWVELIGEITKKRWLLPTDSDTIKSTLLFYTVLAHPVVMIRRSALDESKIYYDNEFVYAEDYDLWARMAETTEFANIPEVLLYYRIHTENLGTTQRNKVIEQANKVRKRLILKLEIAPVEEELEIHEAISNWIFPSTLSFLKKSDLWLEKLNNANKQTRVYSEPAFSNLIAQKRLDIFRGIPLLSIKYLFSNTSLKSKTGFYIQCVQAIFRKIIFQKIGEAAKLFLKKGFNLIRKSRRVEKWRARLRFGIFLQKKIKKNFKIGMAVLAYERPEYLEICLDSLFRSNLYDYDITFLLQDDGSTNSRVREIIERERDSKYKIIRYFTQKGPNCAGAAINKAMKRLMEIGDFDIIGWCDPDAVFHPDWLIRTMEICLWAKRHHRDHILGPFSSFNSSDFMFHKVLGTYFSPYGKYVVKRQMGMLNYFYFKEDFLKLGYFPESKDDETLMTEKFERLNVRNFCTETSYIEHIGQISVLNQWRPVPIKNAVHAINLAGGNWEVEHNQFRLHSELYYATIENEYYKNALNQNIINNIPFSIKLIELIKLIKRLLKKVYNKTFPYLKIKRRWGKKLKKISKAFGIKVNKKLITLPPSKLTIDIIIPAIDKDLKILPYVIDSARNYIKHPIGEIMIVCPNSDLLKELCLEKNCRFIDEDSVLPITKKDINYYVCGMDRSGWLFQQLLKLNGDNLCNHDDFLVLDADTVFITPQVFENNGKFLLELSDEYHMPYFNTFQRLLGEKSSSPNSFVCHHMLFSKATLIQLKEKIEQQNGKPWYEAIVEKVDRSHYSGFSEYETYGNFVFGRFPQRILLEYFYNLSLDVHDIKYIEDLKKKYGRKYKTISFHSYNN